MDKDRKYVIYKHTNIINGKVYIGKTCQNLETRFGSNGIGYRFCPLFYNAIKKYGWNNFNHEILCSDLSEEEANEKEKEYIIQYNSCNREFGYNLREGGNGFTSESSKKLWSNKEYAQHISDCNKKMWEDENYKQTRKERLKESWQDKDKRQRRSEQTQERWKDPAFYQKVRESILNKCKRTVQCIETGEIFDSIVSIKEKYNIITSNISRACKTGYKCAGYHWRYIDNIIVNA